MIAAVHFDNLFFILLIAGAALLRRLAQKAQNAKKNSERKDEPPARRYGTSAAPAPENETDEDRVRKFLEALGQPTTSKPPPPLRPRTDIPPRPVKPMQPPREMVGGRFPRSQSKAQTPREKKIFAPKIPSAPIAAVPAAPRIAPPPVIKTSTEAYAIAPPSPAQAAQPRLDFAALLRSTYNLRDVIVLREIFGPPRSLQDLDLIGSI